MRFIGSYPYISQVYFEGSNEMFLLCQDDLCMDYVYDLRFSNVFAYFQMECVHFFTKTYFS